MILTFGLSLKCANAEAARMLSSVLKPDNKTIPKDQKFSMRRRSSDLVFTIESKRATSAQASLESLLSDAAIFAGIWMMSG